MFNTSSGTKPLLSTRNLARAFSGIQALEDVNLNIGAGSITGIIGPNGCGKTTTVNCITGFDSGYSGEVLLNGRPISRLRPDQIARSGVIRTFQAIRVFDEYSVLQNVLIGCQSFDGLSVIDIVARTKKFRTNEDQARSKARGLLQEVGLETKADEIAGNLSYGQKKLLALATALMSNPKLVILDEPVAGVNPTLAGEVGKTIVRLNRGGTTFLIVEHNIQFIMSVCDNIIVMDRGRQLMNGTPASIQRDPRVVEAYLGGNSYGG